MLKLRKILFLATALSFLLGSNVVLAQAVVEIDWQDPDEYKDIRPTWGTKDRFRERTFKEFEKFMTKLAERLPDGNKLSMTVTDVDLAGQVWPASFIGLGNSGSDVRLIKRIHMPRMKFSYVLTDSDGGVIKQQEVNLKDMGFLDRISGRMHRDRLRYEKSMLQNWFRGEFPDYLAKN